MRRHLTYANVMATLGVFIALGGSSYAAVKITGKDVRNRSLTGKDIKKRSVPLNRLKGSLPPGPAGPVGPAGPKGEPGAPAPPEGVTSLAVGPSQWVSGDAELVPEHSAQRVEFASTTASGSGFLNLHPQLPTTNGAGRTRILAVRVCPVRVRRARGRRAAGRRAVAGRGLHALRAAGSVRAGKGRLRGRPGPDHVVGHRRADAHRGHDDRIRPRAVDLSDMN
jgi:hypothetical protein